MKGKFEILMVIAVLCLPGVMSGEAGPFFTPLQGDGMGGHETSFAAKVDYTVSMPMADADIVYQIALMSEVNPADSLLGQNYLIRWELPSAEGAEGFSAYFDGNYYNFRDDRLKEYHYQWDSIPFLTKSGGVHRNAQFINLFPFSIQKQLEEMAVDSTYNIVGMRQGNLLKLNGVRTLNGAEALQFELLIDAQSGRPVKLYQLFNPGMLGEQEVMASYSYDYQERPSVPSEESELIALFPEAFSRFRTSNFSVENLRGLPFPGFALLTPTRERFLYNKGDRFPSPVIVALLDPEVASAPQTVAVLRQTVKNLPRQTALIMAFTDNDTDRIETLTGAPRIGETVLTSARSLARDTGANSFPTIFLLNSDGTVANVILGWSADLADHLLQQSALLN